MLVSQVCEGAHLSASEYHAGLASEWVETCILGMRPQDLSRAIGQAASACWYLRDPQVWVCL